MRPTDVEWLACYNWLNLPSVLTQKRHHLLQPAGFHQWAPPGVLTHGQHHWFQPAGIHQWVPSLLYLSQLQPTGFRWVET